MTWVKVCGVTSLDAVEAAVAAGADAIGFVSHPGSPRYLSLHAIAELADGVPITTVVLTVDLGVAAAMTAVEATGVTGIQPYGPNARAIVATAADRGLFVLHPIPAGAPDRPADDRAIRLLDTQDETVHGGTGRTFDWSLAADVPAPFVLAGGLDPDNVEEAIRIVAPWGVDASSGLEAAPGIKDPGKVTDFVRKAKQR